MSTLNLAHLMPLSAVWAGPERNDHLNGPPLIVTRTEGATPFRLVTHVGDVGHTLMVGPTGAGKSVLLGTLDAAVSPLCELAHLCLRQGPLGARAPSWAWAASTTTWAPITASPFSRSARLMRSTRASGRRSGSAVFLAHEKVEIDPDVKDAVWSALGKLGVRPTSERTLTGLSVLLQSNRLRQALQPYTLRGPHGRLLDADDDRLGAADVQGFEMEELMHGKSAVLPVLTYLFHRLEERFDGAPTLLILDEAWVFLDDPLFAGRIREWLKTLRKKKCLGGVRHPIAH